MSSSNYRRNKAAIDKFRKELMAMLDDIAEIDVKVLNKAANSGVAFAKRRTPVGQYSNEVTFTVKNGKDVGKVVSFSVSNPGVGGFLRRSWHKLPTQKTSAGAATEIVNNAEYAPYVNYGHRTVDSKGNTTGFVKSKMGDHLLERTVSYVDRQLAVEFEKEVEAVKKRHDK